MRKNIAWLCFALMALSVAPAFGKDHSINGYFRARFITADLSGGKDLDPDTLVDQRARFKWTMNLDEYLAVTYFGEIDMQYGDAGYTNGRNEGGGLAGDSVNLETKNLYLDVKVPDAPVTATIGLQGVRDNWSFAFLLTDMAGVKVATAVDALTANVGWYKLLEGDRNGNGSPGFANTEDDADLLALQVGYKASPELKLGADAYYFSNQGSQQLHPSGRPLNLSLIGSREDLYYLGANADYTLPAAKLSAWAFYNLGTAREGAGAGKDLDISGWAASVKGSFTVAGVKAGVRALYFSGDDDATDSDRSAVRIPWANGVLVEESVPFLDSDLMIMLPDAFGTTYHAGAGFAMRQAYDEYGLWGVTANGAYTPPALANAYVKAAVGYFATVEDDRKTAATKHKGTSVGTELAARVGYHLGKLDLSLNGAYAWLGDFFDATAAGGQDPDNPYEIYAMANLNF